MKKERPQTAAEQLGLKADLVEGPFFNEVRMHSHRSARLIAPKLLEILGSSEFNEKSTGVEQRAQFLNQLESELLLFSYIISDAYTREPFVAKRIAQKRGRDSGTKRGQTSTKSKVMDFALKEWQKYPARTKNALAKEYLRENPDAIFSTVRKYLNEMTQPG